MIANAFVIRTLHRAQHRHVAEHRAPLHVVAADTLEYGIEQRPGRVEMLVEMKIDRFAMPLGGREDDVEIAVGILGHGGRAAHRIA